MALNQTGNPSLEIDPNSLGSAFQQLTERLTDGVCLLDPHGIVTYSNSALRAMLGSSIDEVAGKQLTDIVCQEDQQITLEFLERIQSGSPDVLECRWNTFNGEIWTRCNGVPLNSDGKGVTGAAIIVQNITEARNAELAQAKLAAIFESSDDIIVSKDLNGIVTSWNKSAERIFGYTEKEMIGQPILKILPPERHAEEELTLSKLRRGERIDHFQTVRVAKDGRLVNISATISPIRNREGVIVGASKVARDITDQIRLDEAQARLAAIVESSDDAIVSKDLNGIVKSWNVGAEAIFGYPAEEMIGQPIHKLLPDDRQGEENLILDRLKKGYRIDHYETVRRRKDGRLIDVAVTVSPVRDASGKVIGASKVARDITERKRNEEALQKTQESLRALTEQLEHRVRERTAELETANKEMEGFTYSISHDLRAPLRSIVSASMVTIEDFGKNLPPEAREHLERQAAAAQRMAILIDELLQLSRVSRSKLMRQDIDLTRMSEEIGKELLAANGENPIEFAIQPQMRIFADPRLMRLLIQNLMENARKFSPNGGTVSVGATEMDDEMVYHVKDHGIGFDMKYVEKTFLPFERLVRDDEFPGTGIGLANAKRIVERHSGSIWAESSLGKGATFFFKVAKPAEIDALVADPRYTSPSLHPLY